MKYLKPHLMLFTQLINNKYIIASFLSFFLLVFTPFALSAHANNSDIIIGMSAGFKGPTGGLGSELYRGSMAYIEHINKSGGINGRKIKIIAYDDGYNPAPAIENTIRLIEQDNVFLLFDYLGTPTVTRVLPFNGTSSMKLFMRQMEKHPR